MLEIAHGLLEFRIFPHPIRTVIRGHATNRDVVLAVANALSAFGLSHFETSERLRLSMTVKSCKTLLEANWLSLFPVVSI